MQYSIRMPHPRDGCRQPHPQRHGGDDASVTSRVARSPARRWQGARSFTAMTAPLLVRLDARDRALMMRCAMSPPRSRAAARLAAVTHLGSTRGLDRRRGAAAACPAATCAGRGSWRSPRWCLPPAGPARQAHRGPRPARPGGAGAAIREPDRFSFPSGHATAASPWRSPMRSSFPLLAGRSSCWRCWWDSRACGSACTTRATCWWGSSRLLDSGRGRDSWLRSVQVDSRSSGISPGHRAPGSC